MYEEVNTLLPRQRDIVAVYKIISKGEVAPNAQQSDVQSGTSCTHRNMPADTTLKDT